MTVTPPSPVHVLLDVDGVLNSVRFGKPARDGWGRHEKYKHIFGRYDGASLTGQAHGAFVIKYSPDLIDALNDLAALPLIHFHWLTTWLTEARYGLSRRIGLHGTEWPVLGAGEQTTWAGTDTWWKLKAAQAHVESHPDARIVWIDDDIAFDRAAVEWLKTEPRVMGVCPESEVGLTPEHLDQIRSWIGWRDRT